MPVSSPTRVILLKVKAFIKQREEEPNALESQPFMLNNGTWNLREENQEQLAQMRMDDDVPCPADR